MKRSKNNEKDENIKLKESKDVVGKELKKVRKKDKPKSKDTKKKSKKGREVKKKKKNDSDDKGSKSKSSDPKKDKNNGKNRGISKKQPILCADEEESFTVSGFSDDFVDDANKIYKNSNSKMKVDLNGRSSKSKNSKGSNKKLASKGKGKKK